MARSTGSEPEEREDPAHSASQAWVSELLNSALSVAFVWKLDQNFCCPSSLLLLLCWQQILGSGNCLDFSLSFFLSAVVCEVQTLSR